MKRLEFIKSLLALPFAFKALEEEPVYSKREAAECYPGKWNTITEKQGQELLSLTLDWDLDSLIKTEFVEIDEHWWSGEQ